MEKQALKMDGWICIITAMVYSAKGWKTTLIKKKQRKKIKSRKGRDSWVIYSDLHECKF